MPEKNAVDQFLTEADALEDRRKELVRDLLKQRETALAGFDEALARLGHNAPARRNHHHKSADALKPGRPKLQKVA